MSTDSDSLYTIGDADTASCNHTSSNTAIKQHIVAIKAKSFAVFIVYC